MCVPVVRALRLFAVEFLRAYLTARGGLYFGPVEYRAVAQYRAGTAEFVAGLEAAVRRVPVDRLRLWASLRFEPSSEGREWGLAAFSADYEALVTRRGLERERAYRVRWGPRWVRPERLPPEASLLLALLRTPPLELEDGAREEVVYPEGASLSVAVPRL